MALSRVLVALYRVRSPVTLLLMAESGNVTDKMTTAKHNFTANLFLKSYRLQGYLEWENVTRRRADGNALLFEWEI